MTNERRPDEPELKPETDPEPEPEPEAVPEPEPEPELEADPEEEPEPARPDAARPARPAGAGGYRGALAPRDDRLAAPWLAMVVIIFVMLFVLAFLDVPNRFFADDAPPEIPVPTVDVAPEPTPEAS